MFDDQICNVDSSISIFCENPPCCTSCFLPLQHPQLLPSRHCLVNFGVSAFNLAMVDRNYGNSWMGNMMENMMGLVLTMWENNGTIMKKMGGFLWEFLVFYEKNGNWHEANRKTLEWVGNAIVTVNLLPLERIGNRMIHGIWILGQWIASHGLLIFFTGTRICTPKYRVFTFFSFEAILG